MKTNSYIKAVVFDLSEVLLSGLIGMRADLAIRLGVSTDSVDFRIPELKSLFEGRISEKDFWRALVKEMRWGIDPHELNLLVRAGFVEIMGTREIISNLKECGYTMGLFSVHAKEWINFCEKYFKYRNLFDHVIYSFEIRVCKPEPLAFDILIARLGLCPSEILFIDDSYANLDTASQMGIHTLLFESSTQLTKQLKDLNMIS